MISSSGILQSCGTKALGDFTNHTTIVLSENSDSQNFRHAWTTLFGLRMKLEEQMFEQENCFLNDIGKII